jgi:hypothetical protein
VVTKNRFAVTAESERQEVRIESTILDPTRWLSLPYFIGKVVSRLQMDSRWALARSVRALVAERDALKEKLESTEQLYSARAS